MSYPDGAGDGLLYRAFISYNRRDRQAAKELQSKLESYVILPRFGGHPC